MASGYITSDGKDLDQRYLGIDAKAKSAEVADTASSVSWSGISGKPMVRLPSGPGVFSTARPQRVGTAFVFTAPSDICITYWGATSLGGFSLYINDVLIGQARDVTTDDVVYISAVAYGANGVRTSSRMYPMFLKQGDVVKISGGSSSASFIMAYVPFELQ